MDEPREQPSAGAFVPPPAIAPMPMSTAPSPSHAGRVVRRVGLFLLVALIVAVLGAGWFIYDVARHMC